MAAEVPASKVLRDSVVVNASGSWFHSLIFDRENNISYLRQSFVFTARTYGLRGWARIMTSVISSSLIRELKD